MVDEQYNLYRLASNRMYVPLSNLSAMYHDIDDAMYDDARVTPHGVGRTSPEFGALVESEQDIARDILAEMGITEHEEDVTFTPSLYEGLEDVPRMEKLADAIAREINLAELAFQKVYVNPQEP